MNLINRAEYLRLQHSTNSQEIRTELLRPFRFSWADQVALARLADEIDEPDITVLNRYIRLAQYLELVHEPLEFALRLLRKRHITSEELHAATDILRKRMWYTDQAEVITEHAGFLLSDESLLLTVRQAASGIIKNAAHYPGPHIPLVIQYSITDWPKSSIQIESDLVRAIGDVATHSLDLVKTEMVRAFLMAKTKSLNDYTRENALVAYQLIFS